MKPLLSLLAVTCAMLIIAVATPLQAQPRDTILTDNLVPLKQVVSPNGFIHPGISCDAETLSVMREKVLTGVSPWVDYFEGLRRTPFAKLDQRPRFVEQITDDGGISNFCQDAQLLWSQTILYVVTGNEAYRKRPVELIKWYGGRTDKSFFPKYFSDSHIKIGKYVYTMCSAVDILRTIAARDKSLAVTQEMVDALQANCIEPIRKNCIDRNSYFMNQHSYAIMGFLASTILADDLDGYRRAVEWTTVNATAENQGRNGSIKQQIRLVTRNDKTGQPVEPNLQLVEMGRDQPHANGDIDNLLMMAKTIDFQHTRVDPVNGTVMTATNGVSPIHFLDDRLLKGLLLFVKYNLGYSLTWVPTYSETSPDVTATFNQISYHGRGRLGGNGIAGGYYYYKGLGYDLDQPQYTLLKVAFNAERGARAQATRSGTFINQLHNYAFDFWIGLPSAASDAKPDPEKARRALAVDLAPLDQASEGNAEDGQQFACNFADLSAHAESGDIYPGSPKDAPLSIERDPDGTGYVHMTLNQSVRSMVAFINFPQHSGLRLRSDKLVRLEFYQSEVYAKHPPLQTIYVPATGGAWTCVNTNFENSGILFIQATSYGAAKIDFNRINTGAAKVLPLEFEVTQRDTAVPTYVGRKVDKTYSVGRTAVTYSAKGLPADADFGTATGRLTWTPTPDQIGDHAFYVTAKTAVSICTLRVTIHVDKDLQTALENVAKVCVPSEQYESATLAAFKSALAAKDLDRLIATAEQLKLLTPKLPDGSLDYCKTWSYTICDSAKMADGDPLSFGGVSGFDKNITMDFGRNFKVKSRAFGIQARDGFPIRVAQAVVYGSNNGFDWTLLTQSAAKNVPDFQTLEVKKSQQETPYRFLRFFMPAKAYGIFEISELRVYGQRVEDYSPDYHSAYIRGFEDGTFRPDQNLTRAEAASSLANVMDDYTDKGAYQCNYSDVDQKAWYYDDLAYMTQKGLVATATSKAFEPDAPITRADLAGIMSRMNKLSGHAETKLADVTAATPNAAEIQYVSAKGWLTADRDGRFHPNEPVTRALFVTAVNKMLGRNDKGGENVPAFKDVGQTFWAYDAIMEATHTHAAE